MHFLHAGLNLQEPITMAAALCRANHRRPSADAKIFVGPDGQMMITHPTGSVEEAQAFIIAGVHGTTAILKALQEDRLATYVRNPAEGAYMRVPRFYWFQDRETICGEYVMEEVEAATGWDSSIAGQPIVVPASDVAAWEAIAQDAITKLMAKLGGPASEVAEPIARVHKPSGKYKALAEFERVAKGSAQYADLSDSQLFPVYAAWCVRHGKPAYVRSTFYETLNKIRS